MKLNFKKIATVLGSALMVGSTMGLAAAANYPTPFVQSGAGDVAVVIGANSMDMAYATSIASDLSSKITVGTSTTTSDGASKSMDSGSDYVYLNDEINENIGTLTQTDLPAILTESGEFLDDDGSDYGFDTTVVLGSGATFAFSNSDNDLEDPAFLINLPTSTSTPIYNLTVTFDEAVPFNASASEGEAITLFGKSYTVGTSTDGDTLVLLGGSDGEKISVGETKALVVGSQTYTVTLDGISSDTTAKASITVNGNTKTYTEGQTKEIAEGVDLFAKTVFRTGDNLGHVEIEIGADRLTFEDGSAVKVGSDNTDIDGTLVDITGGVNAMTKLVVSVSAEDNDNNHVPVGGAFIDPVFGSLKLALNSIVNGPEITNMVDGSSSRKKISIDKGGDRELLLTATDAAGNTQTVPFTYQGALTDDDSNAINIVEGALLDKDEYFILNSGNYQHFMQMTKVDADSSGQVTFKDLFTGQSYGTSSGTNHTATQTVYISNQAYSIVRSDDDTVQVYSSDYSTNLAVFPYLELVSGEDHRFALTDEVTIFDDATVASNKTIELPTGSATVTFNNVAGGDCDVAITPTGGSATTIHANASAGAAEDTVTIGSADYVFWANETGTANDACTAVDVTIALEATQIATGDVQETDPAILFVEDEDKSAATTTTKNAVILATSDSGTYSTCSTPVFTSTGYDSATFDDSDYTGYITNFGTYVLYDSDDTNQEFTSLTYPETPMHASIYLAETDASVGGGAAALQPVYDTAVSSVSSKNLIVVGGSCINSVAASLLGSSTPMCGASWETKTGAGAGEFIIQSFASPYSSSKTALLVAGYDAADTQKAATYLVNRPVDTTVGKKYAGTSATEATLVV